MSALHWHEFGQGEKTVLFLHGFMGSGEEWRPIIETLGPAIHGLCPDLPGHGRTQAAEGAAGHSVETCIEGLLQGLDERGVAQCPVVGYSMGGRVALQFTLRHPSRVQRLVLESASPGIEDETQRAVRRARDAQMAGELRALQDNREGFRAFLDEWYRHPMFASLEKQPALRAALIETRLDNSPDGLAESLLGMGAGAQSSLWRDLGSLSCPTLVIVGNLDRKYRLVGEQISESHSSIALYEMNECGHNVHLENPAAFTTVLRPFLLA